MILVERILKSLHLTQDGQLPTRNSGRRALSKKERVAGLFTPAGQLLIRRRRSDRWRRIKRMRRIGRIRAYGPLGCSMNRKAKQDRQRQETVGSHLCHPLHHSRVLTQSDIVFYRGQPSLEYATST